MNVSHKVCLFCALTQKSIQVLLKSRCFNKMGIYTYSRKLQTSQSHVSRAMDWHDYHLTYFLGVEWDLSPLGTSATIHPTVPALDNGWQVLSNRWDNWQGKPKYSEKTCPSATLSTTNPILPDLGCCSGKPVTNCLSYGTAHHLTLLPFTGVTTGTTTLPEIAGRIRSTVTTVRWTSMGWNWRHICHALIG
jgi:hypothetical protein